MNLINLGIPNAIDCLDELSALDARFWSELSANRWRPNPSDAVQQPRSKLDLLAAFRIACLRQRKNLLWSEESGYLIGEYRSCPRK
jgi:hypothetical protein